MVTGAKRVFVRRGPGLEFQPFATLTNGTTVDVQEMQGEWARITTVGGQVGYVNSTFLSLPAEAERQSATPAAPPPPGTAPVRSEAAPLHAVNERNKALEAEVRSLQQELEAQKSRAEATPVAAPAATTPGGATDIEQLKGQLAHLTTAVEGLQRGLADARLAAEPPAATTTTTTPATPAEGSPHSVTSTAILLGVVGLGVGWLMGSAFGRRQERGRRSRVRF
ncbi:MAG TPA: SH3 domain-containing protein [Candidatus Acidoferrales bacterium]|nr:SH3 domain-containing protein [Candidatus Acidoferrales bacterium]